MENEFRFIVMRREDGSHEAMCIDAGCGGLGEGVLDAVYDLRVGLTSAWQLCIEDGVRMDLPPDPPLERIWTAVVSGGVPAKADLDECEIDDAVVSAGRLRIEDAATGRMDVRQLGSVGA